MRKNGRQRFRLGILSAVFLFQFLAATATASDGGSTQKLLALTFDDGPAGRFTSALLDGLAEREVVCTFFVCGYRIADYPQLLQRIAADGHEIGLHGEQHCYLHQLNRDQIAQELIPLSETIQSLTGISPTLLRPPGGLCSEALQAEAAAESLSLVLWSIDPRDWETQDANLIFRRVTNDVKHGDVILMHDGSDSSVTAALAAIDHLMAAGYRFVTVSDLAAATGTTLVPGEKYFYF